MTYRTPLAEFAWPLDRQTYRYSTNVRPANSAVETLAGSWGASVINLDNQYREVIALRRGILEREPARCGALPHTRAASWDTLLFVLQTFAAEHPAAATLTETAPGKYHWENHLLGERQSFRFGDESTLPAPPLKFAASQVEEDLFVLAPREGHLYVDAAASTFASSWSTTFALGMSFHDLHGPVPRIHGSGMADRTERLLMNLEPGEIIRRNNWSIHAGSELDASLEGLDDRDFLRQIEIERTGDFGELRMRVEIQHLVKLPLTGTVLFLIKSQLGQFAEIVTIPEWRSQLFSVLEELPEDMAEYKGFASYRGALLDWFRALPGDPAALIAHTRDGSRDRPRSVA